MKKGSDGKSNKAGWLWCCTNSGPPDTINEVQGFHEAKNPQNLEFQMNDRPQASILQSPREQLTEQEINQTAKQHAVLYAMIPTEQLIQADNAINNSVREQLKNAEWPYKFDEDLQGYSSREKGHLQLPERGDDIPQSRNSLKTAKSYCLCCNNNEHRNSTCSETEVLEDRVRVSDSGTMDKDLSSHHEPLLGQHVKS